MEGAGKVKMEIVKGNKILGKEGKGKKREYKEEN